MFRRLGLVCFLAAAVPGASLAQSTPEAAAEAFGLAVKANDWAAAARLMYPDALRQVRDLFGPLLGTSGGAELGEKLFDARSEAELAAMPDTVMFANFLRNAMLREEGLAEALQGSTFTPLGHVPGGGDTVLVVSRMSFDIQGMVMSQFEVMPFVYHNGRWWGLLKADFTNMAAMLRGAMGVGES